MDINKYLNRIKYTGKVKTDILTLRKLQLLHLQNIPFENLDIHLGRQIHLDLKKMYKKIITGKRGGFCYELNGLFYRLLKEVGYNTEMISARVNDGTGKFGEEFDHMAILVFINGEEWLADVGFGNFAMAPLLITADKPQMAHGVIYKTVYLEDSQYAVEKLDENNTFHREYIFTTVPRKLEDYSQMCTFHQTSPQSPFTQKKICSRATDTGRISITKSKLIITDGKSKTEYEIKSDKEFNSLLKKHFEIELNY